MENNVRQLLLQMERWGEENDAQQTERSLKMLNLEPETAQLLSIMVQSGQRTRLLEIGTSNGYSAIWLAAAVQRTGGHLISIEHSERKQTMAASNLEKAGLSELVTLRLGDALEVLRELEGPFDLVFLDGDRHQYLALLPLLLTRLAPNALLLADNVLSHPDEISPYLAAIDALEDFENVVIRVGKGLSVALKQS